MDGDAVLEEGLNAACRRDPSRALLGRSAWHLCARHGAISQSACISNICLRSRMGRPCGAHFKGPPADSLLGTQCAWLTFALCRVPGIGSDPGPGWANDPTQPKLPAKRPG